MRICEDANSHDRPEGHTGKLWGHRTTCRRDSHTSRPRCHEVYVYYRPYYTHIDGEYKGVHLIKTPSIKTRHLDAASHTLISAVHVLSLKPDVVHYDALGPSALSFVPRITGARTVTAVHGLDWRGASGGLWPSGCFSAVNTGQAITEGMSLSLLEAMAHRKCVIVSDIPENLEVIGDAALTFRAGDAVDLANVIGRVDGDAALAAEFGKKALARVKEEYDWQNIVIRLEEIYGGR